MGVGVMDTVNELGKELKKTKDRASRALKKASPEYGMAERARDIFDPLVPYTMNFRVPRKGMQIRANMQFEYPPPSMGSGGCCGDCYCAVCEIFSVAEVSASSSVLLSRPYEAGSIRVFNGDAIISTGVYESDPDAGIITINSCYGSDNITICYVYKYDSNCTTNTPPIPEPVLTIFDDFDREITGNIIDNTFGNSTTPSAPWYASGPEWSCNGTQLILDPAGAGENYGGWVNIPYDGVSVDPAMPWQDDQYLMEVRFKYTATNYNDAVYFNFQFNKPGSPPNNPADFFFFNMDTNSDENGPWGYISYKNWNGVDYSTSIFHFMTMVPDNWYKCKIQKTSNYVCSMKLWLESGTEPDWQIMDVSQDWGSTSMAINAAGFTNATNYGKLFIDYISFGDPETGFINHLTLFDTFNRVGTPAYLPGYSGDHLFGTSLYPSNAWYGSYDWETNGTSAHSTGYADGPYLISPYNTGNLSDTWINPVYSSTTMPWQTGPFLMEMRFKYSATDPVNYPIGLDLYFQQVQTATTVESKDHFIFSFSSGTVTLKVDADILRVYSGLSFSSNVFYKLKVMKDETSTLYAKIWRDGSGVEPDWQALGASTPKTLYYFGIHPEVSHSSDQFWIEYIAFKKIMIT